MMETLLDKWQSLLSDIQTVFTQMPNLLTMDWQALHFLRPEWFYGFLPLIFLLFALFKKTQNNQSWKKNCDAQLLPHILTTQKGKKSYAPLLLIFIASSLCLTALAGPVLKKLPQPVFRDQSALVILLDLSQSMNAQDIKPSRIERAKLELLDILAQRRGGQSALIVYAADAFTVTPLTDDNATIANLVPSLETSMMPAQGSRLDTALKKARDLFIQAGLKFGDILIISDDIHQPYGQTIKEISASGFRVSIFAIGTAQGSPIPLSNGFLKDKNGAIVIPKLDAQKLQKMALSGHGLYVNIDAGEQDTLSLTNLFQSSLINKNEHDKTKNNIDNLQTNLHADVWQEEGVWLLFPLLFFTALWARKGWLVLIITLTILSDTTPVYADENTSSKNLLNNLWLTPNQKGMRAFKNGEHKKAADKFEHSNWKASALYRNGDYKQAAELFNNASSSDDFYNKGNALAKIGLYEEAVAAYEKAIELNADNEDAAYNNALVKEAIKKQQEQEKQKEQNQSDENNGEKNEDKNQQEGDDSKEQDGEQQESDQKNNEQQNKQDHNGDENQDEKVPENDSEKQASSEQENEQQDEALKQRNPDDQDSKNKQQEQEQLEQEELQQEDQKQEEADSENDEKNNEQEKNQPSQVQEINPREASITEDQQAIEQWLRRIQDDPGGLLRRKFLYQYKNVPNQKDSEQPW